MSSPAIFEPGDVAVHQDVWKDRIWFALPSVAMEDDGDVLVTYQPPGAIYRGQPQRPGPMTPRRPVRSRSIASLRLSVGGR